MADTFSKKSLNEKRTKKKQNKLSKKEDRKTNNDKGKSIEDMLVYVDEFGNLTSVKPETPGLTDIPLEEIQLGAAKGERVTKTYNGILTVFFEDKMFGFITEQNTRDRVFVHANSFLEPIKLNDKVVFEKESTPKGMAAIEVRKK